MSSINRNKVVGLFVAVVAIFAFVAFAPFANGEPTKTLPVGPTTGTGIVKEVKKCDTVTAKKYNAHLRLRAKITGNKKAYKKLLKSKPVCVKPHYKNLKKSIKKQRKKCKRKAITTGASYYGYGDNSPANSATGAYGTLHSMSFAELGMGSAMGGLPPRSWWYVAKAGGTYSQRGQKLDIGAGGGPIGGYTRGIDLWVPFRNSIGLSDNGVVQVSKNDCWAKLKYKK